MLQASDESGTPDESDVSEESEQSDEEDRESEDGEDEEDEKDQEAVEEALKLEGMTRDMADLPHFNSPAEQYENFRSIIGLVWLVLILCPFSTYLLGAQVKLFLFVHKC